MVQFLDVLVDILFFASTLFASAFPLLYFILPWRSTPQGRAIQHFAIGMALMLNLTLLFQVWSPDLQLALGIEAAVLIYVTWAAGYRSWVLLSDIRRHWNRDTDIIVSTDLAGHPHPDMQKPPTSN